jgi:hypothetical protein
MSLTYATYVTTLANLMVVPEDDANFVQILPSIIDYAEGRIYRDLDLLSEIVTDSTATLNANTRTVTLPIPDAGPYNVVEQVNLLTDGVRTPLTPVSRDVLDFMWPSNTAVPNATSTRPVQFAVKDATTLAFGPTSGASVTLEIVGQVKPTPLSDSNTSTYLTSQLPDLFIAASMIFASGYMQNYGAQGDNPQMPGSWTSQYMALLAGADQNAARAEFAGASWSAQRVEPYAQPQRG